MRKVSSIILLVIIGSVATFSQTSPKTAEDYFKIGVEKLSSVQYPEALDAFRMSEQLEPKQPATYANMGFVYMRMKMPVDAVGLFRKAIDLRPSEPTFRTEICLALAASKDFQSAITECKEGVRLAPDSSEAEEALIEVMQRANRPIIERKREVDLALGKFANSIGIISLAADYYYNIERDLPYVTALFERLVNMQPNSAYFHARLADLYLRSDRGVEAVAEARRSLTLEPSNPYGNYFMGKLLLELGQNQDAGEAFSKVVGNDSKFPDAQYYLAITEKRMGHHEAALAAIAEAATRDPDQFEFQYELGDLLSSLARYEDGIIPFKKAVALRPTNLPALAGLGVCLFESTRFEEGIQVLEEANRLYPGNEIISMFLRAARSRQRDMPKIPEMQDYAKANPKEIDVRVNLIQLLAYARRIDDAEVYIQEMWKLTPEDPMPYVYIAVSYSTAGNREKALDAYTRALAIGPDPAIYVCFASIYAERGLPDKASEAYTKVLEMKPNSQGIMQLFGNHLLNSGKRHEALELYRRSLALKPSNGPVLFNAAVLSFKFGDSVAGKQYLAQLRSLDPAAAAQIDRCLRLRIWN